MPDGRMRISSVDSGGVPASPKDAEQFRTAESCLPYTSISSPVELDGIAGLLDVGVCGTPLRQRGFIESGTYGR